MLLDKFQLVPVLTSPESSSVHVATAVYNSFTVNTKVGAEVSTFILPLLHVLGAKSIVQFLFILSYGFLGAMFALMYYDTDTVFTSMTIHALHNTILILFSITGI